MSRMRSSFTSEFKDEMVKLYLEMCARLHVSTSGYYEWLSRPASATALRRDRLKTLIIKAFELSEGRYAVRMASSSMIALSVRRPAAMAAAAPRTLETGVRYKEV